MKNCQNLYEKKTFDEASSNSNGSLLTIESLFFLRYKEKSDIKESDEGSTVLISTCDAVNTFSLLRAERDVLITCISCIAYFL